MDSLLARRWLGAIDRPTAEAVKMAQEPLIGTAARAFLGLTLTAAASLVASGLDLASRFGPVRADALLAALEAMAVVVPGMIIAMIYFGVRARPRELLAAVAVALLIGGLSSVAVLPLLGYLVLVNSALPWTVVPFGLVVPPVALFAVAVVTLRVVVSLDPARRTIWIAHGSAALLFAVFAMRMLPALGAVMKGHF